ncbi:unnamed protein product [Adineta ricciae]|nr:unnamed protein product [Adineta ricciae]
MNETSMKRTNRIRMRMNSLQQRSNGRWKQFANVYAKFLLRFPWSILLVSSLITIGLASCCLFFMEIRPFDQTDFLMPHGLAITNALLIRRIFGSDTELRMHQQLNLYPGLDIIMKRRLNTVEGHPNQTNMLRNEILDEVHRLDRHIRSVRITDENKTMEYNYSTLCTQINQACVVDGNYILSDKFRHDLTHLLPPKSGYYFDTTGANGIPEFMFGKDYRMTNATSSMVDYDEEEEEEEYNDQNHTPTMHHATSEKIITYVPVFRLRYTMNTSTPERRQLAILWEREALRYLNQEYRSEILEILPSTSTAIADAIVEKAHGEGLYMSIMLLIFIILVCLCVTIQGNFHTSVGYLPLCGILSIALSTGATFGILSMCRIKIIEPMALLVFVVAIVECLRISIVCGEYHRILKDHLLTLTDVSSEIDIEKILPSIIESTHPYFLISTLIITIVYSLLSIFSPMITTLLICLTLVLYIIVNYLVHATFFSSCLVITLKRVVARRHCLFCFRLSKDCCEDSEEEITTKWIFIKQKLSSLSIKDSVIKKFVAATLCLLFVLSMITSLWFFLSIDTRLFDDQFLPRDASSLRLHMKSQESDFNIGPVVMFTIPETINYENEQVRLAMRTLLEQCQSELRTNDFQLLWLDHENVTHLITGKDPISLRVTPFSQNDLVIVDRENTSAIMASRFYCQMTSIKGDRLDIRTMNNLYTYTDQSPLPSVFPYSLLFPTYEALEQIRNEIYLSILLLIVACFILTLVPWFSFSNTLLTISHVLALLTSSLTCLYFFHKLTFNFGNALWFYVVSIIYLETLIHACYKRSDSKWKYNRIILSLLTSLVVLHFIPIQAYVFQIIRNSLIYHSIVCLILINLILPSCDYLIQSMNQNDEQIHKVRQPMVTIIDVNQSLTNGIEIKADVYETKTSLNSSI